MANKIEFRITGKDDFSKSMRKVDSALATTRKGLTRMSNTIFNLKNVVVGLAASVGGAMLAKEFISAASTTEQLRVRLSVLLGTVEEGNELFQAMSEYASEVPFQYEEIMEAATQLAGIMEGGSKQVQEWMPMIGDLAAASGLSIQQTTEQVVRMYSAGAASADLFRERGITAMLGFQTGVSYSVEETREMLMEAWDGPTSKFKDASLKLASTWDGLLSMIGDKWFNMRNIIMDAGLFSYIKALAVQFNKYFGEMLGTTSDNAKTWADTIIRMFESLVRNIAKAIDWVTPIISSIGSALQSIWDGYQSLPGWAQNVGIAGALMFGKKGVAVLALAAKFADDSKVTAEWFAAYQAGHISFSEWLTTGSEEARAKLESLKTSMQDTLSGVMPEGGGTVPDKIFGEPGEMEARAELFLSGVRGVYEGIQAEQETMKAMVGGGDEGDESSINPLGSNEHLSKNLSVRYERLSQAMLSEQELLQLRYEEDLNLLTESFMNELVTEEQHLEDVAALNKRFAEQTLKDQNKFIKRKYQMNLQGLTAEQNLAAGAFNQMLGDGAQYSKSMFKLNKGAGIAQATISTFQGAAKAMEWGWPMGPIFAAAMVISGLAQVAKIKSQSFSGQADAGMDYVPYAGTYMLSQGERVIKPEQNRDLTSFLSGGGGSGDVTIENIQIDVLPNATNAESILTLSDLEWRELVADKIINALNMLYRQGVYPVYAEQEA